MKIREENKNKKQFISLLLLADEQEDMVDRYFEKGTMYILEDNNVKAECVVTDEGNGILEIKNIAVDPNHHGIGYGNALIDFLANKYTGNYSILQVGTGDSPLTIPFYEKCGFVKEIYNMKKVCLAVLPALTIVLELLPLGAVCIFATSPTERVKETFSYFSLTPFGYANFAPLITATLTVAIFLLSLFSLKKKGVLKALFVLSIITVVISLLPLMYGLNYYTLVGAFITVTLVIESVLAKIQQK